MYEVDFEFEVWSLVFDLFRSSKQRLWMGKIGIPSCESQANFTHSENSKFIDGLFSAMPTTGSDKIMWTFMTFLLLFVTFVRVTSSSICFRRLTPDCLWSDPSWSNMFFCCCFFSQPFRFLFKLPLGPLICFNTGF